MFSATLGVACLVTTFWICQSKKIPVLSNYSATWAALVMSKSYTRGTCYFIGVFLFFYHTRSLTFTKVVSVENKVHEKRLRHSFNSSLLPSFRKSKVDLESPGIEQPLLADQKDRNDVALGEPRRANSLIFEYRGKKLVCSPSSSQVKIVLIGLAGFLSVFVLLLQVFALMKKPNAVAQIWHSLFNSFVGPLISLSVVYLFDGLLGFVRVKARRPFNTKQYNRSTGRDSIRKIALANQSSVLPFTAKASEQTHLD